MKKPTKKHNRKQISAWSVSNQLNILNHKLKKIGLRGKIGLLMAVLSICITVYVNFLEESVKEFSYQTSASEIKAVLTKYRKAKDWIAHAATLEKTDSKYCVTDWYNFNSALSAIKTNPMLQSSRTAEYYLKQIDPLSPYFSKCINVLLSNYGLLNNDVLYKEKMNRLVDYLESIEYKEPEFFLVELKSKGRKAKTDDLLEIYRDIKSTYPEVFSNPVGSITLNFQKTGISKEIPFGKITKLYGISFMYAFLLKDSKMSGEIRRDLKTMFPNPELFETAETGMLGLHVQLSNSDRYKYRFFINTL